MNAPAMTESSLERGRLEDEVLNVMGIFSLAPGEHKDREEKTFCQQGPTIITHAQTVERFKALRVRAQLAVTEGEQSSCKGKSS